MSETVLVTYATKYGSTREVAEAVAETLRKKGLEVELQPARQVRSLKAYDAVVLGAPLYLYRWHRDALRFLSRHNEPLKKIPVAIFALGPSFKGDEKEWQEARDQLKKELGGFPWFKPVEVEVLGGKFDPQKLTFPTKAFLKDLTAADLRDWDAIAAWAGELAGKLSP